MKRKTQKSKKIKKTPKPTEFELASQDNVDKFEKEVSVVLKALGYTEYLVTDESAVSDFLPFSAHREKCFNKFKKKMNSIGVEVNKNDMIIDVAKRIKDK